MSLSANAAQHTVPVDVPAAFHFACEVLERDCKDIPIPKVIVDKNQPDEGEEIDLFDLPPCADGKLWGYTTWVGNEVHLCAAQLYFADPVFIQSVAAHELAHYLDAYGKEPMSVDGCTTEWNGHRVGNAYVVSHGHPEWVDYDWYQWYNCYLKGDDNVELDQ